MQLIRLTAKLVKEMGRKPQDLHEGEPAFSVLGPWHANLIYINRRKALLFVNDRTLFNFIVPDVSRSRIRNLPDEFRSMLSCVLAAESAPDDVRGRVLAEYRDIGFAKSSDRSVLGSSNDIAFHYKHRLLESGGIHSSRVPDIIKELNRMPMQSIRYAFPIEELAQLYGFAASAT
jgi:hypothetical protein